jgi:hypothetical protein
VDIRAGSAECVEHTSVGPALSPPVPRVDLLTTENEAERHSYQPVLILTEEFQEELQ